MKLMVIAEDKEFLNCLEEHFTPLDAWIITYRNPLKGIDNIREINPDVLLFSEKDFPRHWGVATKTLCECHKEASFILIVRPQFRKRSVHRATFLGVHGFFRVGDPLHALEAQIRHLRKSSLIEDFSPPKRKQAIFCFLTDPRTLEVISTEVVELSPTGAIVKPLEGHRALRLKPEDLLRTCSLRIGKEFLTFQGIIEKTGSLLSFRFHQISTDFEKKLQRGVCQCFDSL